MKPISKYHITSDLNNEVAVLAFEAGTNKFEGEFPSIAKAERTLYIRKGNIKSDIHSKKPNGVTSYKDGRKFNFQLKGKENG